MEWKAGPMDDFMLASLDCPEVERWQILFADQATPEQWGHYERHLESCATCQERIDQAETAGDLLRQQAQRLGDPTRAPSDPMLDQVVARLCERKGQERAAPVETADLYFLRPSDRPDILGRLGVYEVREVIGRGGMGIVLKAFDPTLERLVAIKVLTPLLAGSDHARRRFLREARAAAAVRHEHLVAVHGVDEVDGLPNLVMQFIDGESLQARLDRTGPLPLEEVVQIGLQTARGLAAAHAQGLIHRDIKPANLLLNTLTELRPLGSGGPAFQVKITDFGLARLIDDVNLTQSGLVVGTPEYMAHEQAHGEPVDTRADLFSLGSVLYALCTGVPPFRAATSLAVLRQVSEVTPRPVRSLNPAVPAWLEALISRLLVKDPAGRYQSAAEVADLLEGRLNRLRSPERGEKEENPGWARPSPGHLWLAALTALTTLGLALLAFGAGGVDGQPGEWHEVLFHDFRKPPVPPSFSFWGDPEGKFLKAEPEGMRITLPATYVHPFGGIGYLIEQGLQGDFEVTATVEVLHADPPATGYGVGVVLAVNKADSARGEWASLGRQKRPQSGDVLYSATGTELPPGFEGDEEPDGQTAPETNGDHPGLSLGARTQGRSVSHHPPVRLRA
jgi:serine/threonine protein kinase